VLITQTLTSTAKKIIIECEAYSEDARSKNITYTPVLRSQASSTTSQFARKVALNMLGNTGAGYRLTNVNTTELWVRTENIVFEVVWSSCKRWKQQRRQSG
jgi:hypothetical protein